MSDLSFHEKSAWGTLVANLVVGALFFSSVWNLWRADQLSAPILVRFAIGYTIFLVAALVIYHVVIAALNRPEDEDERDRLIGWRAAAVGGLVLAFGVFGLIGHLILGALFDRGTGNALADSPLMLANALLLAVLIATVAELGSKLYFYRRGL